MSIDVDWYDRKQGVARCEAINICTVEEIYLTYDKLVELSNEIEQPISLICNIVQFTPPIKGNVMRPLQMALTSEYIKRIVVVNGGIQRSKVGRGIITVLQSVMPINEVLFANTDEQAYQILTSSKNSSP